MRWSTRKWHDKKDARKRAKREWHLWFAWFPVRLNITAHDALAFEFRWLENVARRYREHSCSEYIYSDPSAILVEKIRKSCEDEQIGCSVSG